MKFSFWRKHKFKFLVEMSAMAGVLLLLFPPVAETHKRPWVSGKLKLDGDAGSQNIGSSGKLRKFGIGSVHETCCGSKKASLLSETSQPTSMLILRYRVTLLNWVKHFCFPEKHWEQRDIEFLNKSPKYFKFKRNCTYCFGECNIFTREMCSPLYIFQNAKPCPNGLIKFYI